MQETVLTTLIYKYNSHARFVLVLYIVAMFTVYLFGVEIIPAYIMSMAICIWAIPLVYAAVSKKTVFNFRAFDSRLLTLSPSFIQLGRDRYPISQLALELHINAYDGFVYRIREKGLLAPQITYGFNNELLITYKGTTRDHEFLLRTYADYTMLYAVIDQWRLAGVKIKVKEAFTKEFVDKQHARLLRRRW